MPEQLYALTLHQPWAWAVAYAGKRIENRTWRPPQRIIGRQIAIHAGRTIDAGGVKWLAERGFTEIPMPKEAHVRGTIVAVAIVEGYVYPKQTAWDDVWLIGPVGWVLRDVITLPFAVDCRGMQGLWPVPMHIAELVLQQIREG